MVCSGNRLVTAFSVADDGAVPCSADHSDATILSRSGPSDCTQMDESTRPLTGLGSGVKSHESSFPGKCVGGGHAGIGHRSGAVGNQDFLRRLNKQELASGDIVICVEASDTRSLPRRRKPAVRVQRAG